MNRPAGQSLLVLLVLILLGSTFGRSALQARQPAPAVVVTDEPRLVLLGPGFPSPGVRQFSDGDTLMSVIHMTLGPVPSDLSLAGELWQRLEPGMALDIRKKDVIILEVMVGWMPAAQRMALGIRLHPDRMTLTDWTALDGIGEKLATRIELDRQLNGDFVRLAALRRVKGIGPKRLEAWQEFF